MSISYSESVFVALVTQHAKRMRHITLSCAACLTLSYFSTFFHFETIRGGRGGGTLAEHHKVWVLILYITICETLIIIKIIHRDIIMNQSFIYSPTDVPLSCLKKQY